MQESSKDKITDFHCRAGKWYGENGFEYEAVDHFIQGLNYERANYWIESFLGSNFEIIGNYTRERWLAAFPDEFLGSMPNLILIEAWSDLKNGYLEKVERSLDTLEKSLSLMENKEQTGQNRNAKILGKASLIRSVMGEYRGNPSEVILFGKKALETLPEEDLFWRCITSISMADALALQGEVDKAQIIRSKAFSEGLKSEDPILSLAVNLRNARVLRKQGKLNEVVTICQKVIEEINASTMVNEAAIGWLLAIYGEVLAETNHLNDALEYAKDGASKSQKSGDIPGMVVTGLYLIRTLFSSGDISGADDVHHSLEELFENPERTIPLKTQYQAWKVRIWLAKEQFHYTDIWVKEQVIDLQEDPIRMDEDKYFSMARIWIAQGQTEEAIQILEWAFPMAESDGRYSAVIESLSLQALGHHAAEDLNLALKKLQEALSLAEPLGLFRIFLDEGPSMARLLYEAAKQDIQTGYVRRLLSGIPTAESESVIQKNENMEQKGLMEPLSEREIDVLELVAEGLSNEQIGEKLFISIHTVKVHTRNIYGKLDSHNRTEAVARARNFGIIPLT